VVGAATVTKPRVIASALIASALIASALIASALIASALIASALIASALIASALIASTLIASTLIERGLIALVGGTSGRRVEPWLRGYGRRARERGAKRPRQPRRRVGGDVGWMDE
jgi:hypothetical protein